MRTRIFTVCGYERPAARSKDSEALDEWKARAKEDLSGDTEVFRLDD